MHGLPERPGFDILFLQRQAHFFGRSFGFSRIERANRKPAVRFRPGRLGHKAYAVNCPKDFVVILEYVPALFYWIEHFRHKSEIVLTFSDFY